MSDDPNSWEALRRLAGEAGWKFDDAVVERLRNTRADPSRPKMTSQEFAASVENALSSGRVYAPTEQQRQPL
jgi:hypothetical protein